MKFGLDGFKEFRRWPSYWSKPATFLGRILRPLVVLWMKKKRLKIVEAPRVSSQIPIVCIGNIVLGGAGKTPLVASLALKLREAGFTPEL